MNELIQKPEFTARRPLACFPGNGAVVDPHTPLRPGPHKRELRKKFGSHPLGWNKGLESFTDIAKCQASLGGIGRCRSNGSHN